MSLPQSDLYQSLAIDRDASPEQIRKAYRKRALQTHPDRLPTDATDNDRQAAADEFRKVNNAYEILSNDSNRRLYDQQGVWPPVDGQPADSEYENEWWDNQRHRSARHHRRQQSNHHHHHHHPLYFDDPFEHHPFFNRFERHHESFRFTDPMELFERAFRDMEQAFWHSGPYPGPPMSSFRSQFRSTPFGNMVFPVPSDPWFGGGRHHQPAGHSLLTNSMWNVNSFSPIHHSENRIQGTQMMTQSINGVTHTLRREIDREGNEHVTKTYPDGRQQVFYNGVEQPGGRALEESKASVTPLESSSRSSKKWWWKG